MIDNNLDQRLAESYRPKIKVVGDTTLVGEIHIKTSSNPEVESDFDSRLKGAEFIILEHRPTPDDFFSKESRSKRFMQQALEHSKETGKQMTVLDEEFSDRYKCWLNAGIEISRDNFYLLLGTHFLLDDFSKGIPTQQSLVKLTQLYKNLYKDEDQAKKLAAGVTMNIYGPGEIEKIGDKFNLILDYIKVDNGAREIYYQQRISQISRNLNGRKMLVVVGQDHVDPIANTLNTGSITQIDSAQVKRINESLSMIREKYNLN